MKDIQLPFGQHYRINALRVAGAIGFCFLAITAAPLPLPLLSSFLEICGISAIFIAIAGRGWVLLYIGGRKNSELVTSGPYSITRNPLYVFSLTGITGVGLLTGSLISMTAFVLCAYLAFEMAIRGEEAYLSSRYGHRFQAYKQAVPRFWPDFSLWYESEALPLRSGRALASLKDGIVFILAWIGIELLKVGQDAGLLPVVLALPF
ncbi:methyltransferase family protein [Affinirhizobium pseudoryzae]|uniref:methyltransferase family protein n=1 Tax=Allorhizobium pseudoryzae TaxID=379684 RepID=UPI0013EC9EA1|nr:isoprenylcysteine carboxylmethyltransferase family protein [Allorhizobium pseudoryzae]